MRPAICSGGRPVYCQTTPITGIRISGKMSVGERSAASGPMIRRSSASTTNVYGRLKAIRTSAVIDRAFLDQAKEFAISGEIDCGDLLELAEFANAQPRFPYAIRHTFNLTA